MDNITEYYPLPRWQDKFRLLRFNWIPRPVVLPDSCLGYIWLLPCAG